MDTFKDFYIDNFTKAKEFVLQYIAEDDDAVNIVHDVFLTMYERWGNFDETDNLAGYLFTALKNQALNYLAMQISHDKVKREIYKKKMFEIKLNYNSLSQFDTSDIDDQEVYDRVYQSIDRLPEKCRRIFIMNKVEGKSRKEIASILGITVNTVQVQICIAYKKLREDLRDLFPLMLFLMYFH